MVRATNARPNFKISVQRVPRAKDSIAWVRCDFGNVFTKGHLAAEKKAYNFYLAHTRKNVVFGGKVEGGI